MRIASITAGAAGMFCGSCLHDNSLASALHTLGHDAILIPTYTPIRTDSDDFSQRRVFLGGLNVYFNYKSSLFSRMPRFVHWLLDRPALLRALNRFTATPDYAALGEMTLTVLRGEQDRQRREINKLVRWLADDLRPEVVMISNVLLSGLVPPLKQKHKAPVIAYLQGDDIYLDSLRAEHRTQAIELIRQNSRHIDGYLATCVYYADFMAEYLGIPRSAIDVAYPGISLSGHGGPREHGAEPPFTIGYFARIAPEKGLHQLADAFVQLRRMANSPRCRLRAAGWLGAQHKPYLDNVRQILEKAGLADDFEYVDCPDLASKVRFLQTLDVFSVPTTYREPKGLYVLEALANGVPVVLPSHGSLPELIERTGGGLLVEPGDTSGLAQAIHQLLVNPGLRREMGGKGRAAIQTKFSSEVEARHTVSLLSRFTANPVS